MITLVLAPPKQGKSSFKKLVSYAEDAKGEGEKCLYANCRGFEPEECVTQEMRIKTMVATAAENVLCEDPVWHGVMSFCAGEIPTQEQIEECMDIYLKEYGFEGCQVVYAAHKNTDFVHIHVALNKVHPDTGKVVDTWNSYKTAQKISRTIELEQGWEQAKGGKFYNIEGNELVYLDDYGRQISKPIKQEAKDFERRNAEKSAMRIAQNKIQKNLWEVVDGDITTWNDLHHALAEKGFELKKEGRGAVVVLHQDEEEIPIKLSSLSQKFSLSKFEKKLGEFEERKPEIKIKEETRQPLIDNNKALAEYVEEKKKFIAERRKLTKELSSFNKYKKARELELREKQKQERKELFGYKGKWKGKSAELNRQRSLLAAKHLSEKQELKEILLEEKAYLPEQFKRVKQIKFPDYCLWQEQRNNPDAKWRFVYCKTLYGRALDGSGEDRDVKPKTKTFLQSYTTSYDIKKGLSFYNKKEELSFRDTGKKITILLQDENNIKDALLLAQEKWGKVKLNGTDEFKKKAVEIALKNNIQITNPELQELIQMKTKENERAMKEAYRVAITSSNEVKDHITYFNDYTDMLSTEHFRITCAKDMPDGKKSCFLLVNEDGQKEMQPYEIQAQWEKIEKLNKEGYNVYVTPMPEPDGKELYILVDDLTKDKLSEMKNDGIKPAAVFESSPGNYQAMIIVEKNFVETDEKSREMNKQAANKLMSELNSYYGDPNIRAAIHPHRIPGMNNNKPKRIAQNGGKAPEVKLVEFNVDAAREKESERSKEKKIGKGVHCTVTQQLFDKHVLEIRQQFKEEEKQRAAVNKKMFNIGHDNTDTIDPATAFVIHARDIIQHHGAANDYSRLDAEVVVRLRATGYNTLQIKEAVQGGSPAMRPPEKRNKQWKNYAEKTAKYSESFHCMEKVRQQEHRIGAWLALEGRTKKQQRTQEKSNQNKGMSM